MGELTGGETKKWESRANSPNPLRPGRNGKPAALHLQGFPQERLNAKEISQLPEAGNCEIESPPKVVGSAAVPKNGGS